MSAYVREIARQIDGALFERAVLNPPKVSTALREVHPAAEAIFRDAYFVEFLGLPDGHHEIDLHAALLQNMRRFLAELGRDFCFIGSEVPLQVGGKDFARISLGRWLFPQSAGLALNEDRARTSSKACATWPSRSADPLSNQDDTAVLSAAMPSWAASLARR